MFAVTMPRVPFTRGFFSPRIFADGRGSIGALKEFSTPVIFLRRKTWPRAAMGIRVHPRKSAVKIAVSLLRRLGVQSRFGESIGSEVRADVIAARDVEDE